MSEGQGLGNNDKVGFLQFYAQPVECCSLQICCKSPQAVGLVVDVALPSSHPDAFPIRSREVNVMAVYDAEIASTILFQAVF